MYQINIGIKNNECYIKSKNIKVTKNFLNTIECLFDIPEEYTNLTTVAIFIKDSKSYKVSIIKNKAIIPIEVLNEENTDITIGIIAYQLNELIYSPKPAKLFIENGSYVDNFEESINFTQSDLDIYLTEAKNIYNNIENSANIILDGFGDILKKIKLDVNEENGKLYLTIPKDESENLDGEIE